MRRKSRLQYHYSVKCIERNKELIKSEKMASKNPNNKDQLWREAKKMRGTNNRLPEIVDDILGDEEISNLFGGKFDCIYNSVSYSSVELNEIRNTIEKRIKDNILSPDNILSATLCTEDINTALQSLKAGKSDGNLGIYSDHIIHGTDLLYKYISMLFNAMLIHGYTPDQMCMGTIIPIVKNKRKSTNDSDNFRGICLQSSLCKLLDILILSKEKDKLITSENQFGYKSKMSTHAAAAIVKETIDYYKSKGGTVYCLSLDVSKAFDCVDFCKLFNLLIEINVNPVIIRLFLNMYTNQKNCVRYNQAYSNLFDISNGVKQGGVLSPTLFCIYIDNLLISLKESGFGCKYGDAYVGCVAYADDIILLCASLYGLKHQIKICENYAHEYKLKFNGEKSQLIIFSQDGLEQFPDVFMCGETVAKVDKLKYLGIIFSNGPDDSFQSSVIKDFNCKLNVFMSDFKKVTSKLRNKLFNNYCCSYYGSSLCKFQNLKRIDIQWKKAIRRIWKLPWRARSAFLPHISQSLPPSVKFMKSFAKFFLNNMQSSNTVINFVFQSALSNDTRLGNNFRYILYMHELTITDIKQRNIDFDVLWKIILRKWNMSSDENSNRIGTHILELILRRDSLEPWLLSKREIQDVIELISTS